MSNRELGIYLTLTINPSIDSMKIDSCNRAEKTEFENTLFKRKKFYEMTLFVWRAKKILFNKLMYNYDEDEFQLRLLA